MSHQAPDRTLEPLDESFGRVLVVVAHPDDIEYGGAAAGKQVTYCLATSGEAGIDGTDGIDPAEHGLPLRPAVAGAVRRHRPDVVVTINHHDTWGPGGLNQADHVALGRAVLDGVRDGVRGDPVLSRGPVRPPDRIGS